ncbi:MAG TPA: thioredoxin family protein [Pirellulales bacterium]|jgi:predicted dithiol-disulfide oxidoreductase (DUF899 family)
MNSTTTTPDHTVVSHDEWRRAHSAFLAKEKELTRLSDELSRQRRALPWTQVEKQYKFQSLQGETNLAGLFAGCSQLATYHFMFNPDWDEGCPGCSYVMDHVNGAIEHLRGRDVSLVAVSRAPLAKLTAFKSRMGWRFPWVSSASTDFNRDFGVHFTPAEVASKANAYNFATIPPHGEDNPGLSCFYKDPSGEIFHTYSGFARSLEAMLGTYVILDRSPKGRDEDALPAPMSWVRHHDKYEPTLQAAKSCCHEK